MLFQLLPRTLFILVALLTLLALLVANPSASAQTKATTLKAEINYIDLNINSPYYSPPQESPTQKLTPQDAYSAFQQGKFIQHHSPHRNYGHIANAIWFYIQLNVADSALNEDWLLELNYTLINKFEVYELDEQTQQWVQRYANTNNSQEHQRGNKLNATFATPLQWKTPGKKQFLIKVDTAGLTLVPLNLWKESDWQKAVTLRNIVLSLFYGAILVMLFYNLMLYFGTRHRVYIYYCAYVATITIFLASGDGFLLKIVSLESAETLRTLNVAFSGITSFFVTLFATSFLCTGERFPTLHKIIFAVGSILGLAGVCALTFSVDLGSSTVSSITPLFAIVLMITTVKSLQSGYREARLFFIGWMTMFFTSIYTSLGLMGMFDWSVTLEYSMHVATVIEIVLLSLALADRINTYKKLKDKAELAVKKELVSKYKMLKENNRIKDEFIATVSHELRTPLNGIIGAIELASNETEAIQRKRFEEIGLTSSYRLNAIVDDMLVFSELLTGKPELSMASFALNPWLDAVIAPYAEAANHKNLKLRLEQPSPVPSFVEGDQKKLELAVKHILDNAVKFTQAGEINIHVSYQNNQLHIRIADTGCGMDESTQGSIFESFRQADGSFSRAHGGLGIGLAIVQKLITLMDGNLQLKSTPQAGSVFTLSIPLKTTSSETVSTSKLSAEDLNTTDLNFSILVVEDNLVNQKVLCGILKKLGCKTDIANNGIEAVSHCRANRYDLIFMDCQMPEMNGFEATLRIRQMETDNKNIPIIAVTANATEQDMKHCYQVGMNDFIKKPVNRRAIAEQLVLKLKRAA